MPSGISFSEISSWVRQKYPRAVKLNRDMLFGEFVSYIFSTNMCTKEDLHSKPKTFIFDMINRLGDYKIHNVTEQLILDEALEAFPSHANTRKKYRNDFRTIFFMPALKLGFVARKEIKQEWAITQCELLDAAVDNQKNWGMIGIDVCEFLNSTKSKFVHCPRSYNYIKDIFASIWSKRWKDLSNEEINEIRTSLAERQIKKYIAKIIDHAVKKGTLLENITAAPEAQNISLNSDLWRYKDRNGTMSTLDFSNIRKEIKLPIKLWLQWRIMGNQSANTRAKRVIEKYFIPFLEKEKITINKFSNPKKKKLLVWFRTELIKNSTEMSLTLAYEQIVQFVRFLQNNHPKKINQGVVFLTGEVPFKETKRQRDGYTDREIEQLSNALLRDHDRLIVNILLLFMLTAKRFDEILKLENDCIVNIDKFTYLKYTNFKTDSEDLMPLQSNNISGSSSLFNCDIAETVLKCVNEIREMSLPHKALCSAEDAEKLITVGYGLRDRNGYMSGLPSRTYFSKRIKEFGTRNAIDFKLEVHRFRHTLATKIIRDGHGHDVAARILGNKSHTVEKYYESDISKTDTLKLKISPMINAKEDAKELMGFDNTPEYIEENDSAYIASVPGGKCKDGLYAVKNCKYYNRLFGNGGCLGCSQLGVSGEHLPYYSNLYDDITAELEEMEGTPFEVPIISKLALVGSTLSKIKQKEGKND